MAKALVGIINTELTIASSLKKKIFFKVTFYKFQPKIAQLARSMNVFPNKKTANITISSIGQGENILPHSCGIIFV